MVAVTQFKRINENDWKAAQFNIIETKQTDGRHGDESDNCLVI